MSHFKLKSFVLFIRIISSPLLLRPFSKCGISVLLLVYSIERGRLYCVCFQCLFGKSSTAAMQSEVWSAITYHNKYVMFGLFYLCFTFYY